MILLYAITDIFDSVQGYMADGKMPWLVWNAGLGVLVMGGVAIAAKRPKLGYSICALFAGLDTIFFGRKLLMTMAVWPAGVTTILSVCALACAVVGMIRSRSS